jgi:nucleoid-associated protein YgaU
MSAINPQFVHNGKWMNIQIGDELNIPPTWKEHLSSIYHVTDASTASSAPVTPPPVEFIPPAVVPVAAPPAESVATPPANGIPPVPIQMIPNAEPLHPSGEATPAAYTTSDATSGSVPALASVPPSAGVATGGTYTVKKGDFPIKIAKALTGDSNRWHELIAANPTKPTKSDGNFATLMPGEVLHLPATWNTLALSGGAHAQVA